MSILVDLLKERGAVLTLIFPGFLAELNRKDGFPRKQIHDEFVGVGSSPKDLCFVIMANGCDQFIELALRLVLFQCESLFDAPNVAGKREMINFVVPTELI